jgi:hypothetical protein
MDSDKTVPGWPVHLEPVSMLQNLHEWILAMITAFNSATLEANRLKSLQSYKVQRLLLQEINFQAAQDPTIFGSGNRTDEEHALRIAYDDQQRDTFLARRRPRPSVPSSVEGFAQVYMNILQKDPRNASQDIAIVKRALYLIRQLEDHSIARRVSLSRQLAEPASRSCRMFSTRAGFIGMGPASLAPGDQVWFLRGLRAPAILRPVDNGRYRWGGETYVHGRMHREALTNANIIFHDIELE